MKQGRARGTPHCHRVGPTHWIAVVGALAVAAIVGSGDALAVGGPVLNAPQGSKPQIDGSVAAGEWADAAWLPIHFQGHPADLYVKHDDQFLYVLVTVADSPPPGGTTCCSMAMYFDNNNDERQDTGEDLMTFGPEDQSSDQYYGPDPAGGPSGYFDDTNDGGTYDTRAAGSYDAPVGRLILEASKPLCSGDNAHDFCLQDGAVVGFTLNYSSPSGGAAANYPASPDKFTDFAKLGISAKSLNADLQVQVKSDKTKPINAGAMVTYTISVTNRGPDPATNIVLDTFFAKSSGVTATLPKAPTRTLGTLAPGATRVVTPKPQVRPSSVAASGGTISLNAVASASEPDPTQANNAYKLTVAVTPAPATGEAVTTQRAGGRVTINTPGPGGFVPLGTGQSIPTGSEVDASHGSVKITSATPAKKRQTATVSAGRFKVTQSKRNALTSLQLTAPTPIKCGPRKGGPYILRRLSVDAKGQFRTVGAQKGAYAMPEKGRAKWVTTDWCAPVGYRFPAAANKKIKWGPHTCFRNASDETDICVKKPQNRHEVMVGPGKKACG